MKRRNLLLLFLLISYLPILMYGQESTPQKEFWLEVVQYPTEGQCDGIIELKGTHLDEIAGQHKSSYCGIVDDDNPAPDFTLEHLCESVRVKWTFWNYVEDCSYELYFNFKDCNEDYENNFSVEKKDIKNCTDEGINESGFVKISAKDGESYSFKWKKHVRVLDQSNWIVGVDETYLGVEEIGAESTLDDITIPAMYYADISKEGSDKCIVIDEEFGVIEITEDCQGNQQGELIINEFSNGISNVYDEYVELLVKGTGEPCSTMDLRGYILDDNNGEFSPESNDVTGRAISKGCLRFPDDPAWAEIPVGTLIVIYDENRKNALIEEDDLSDEDGDGVYILPASALDGYINSPTLYSEEYLSNTEYQQGEWALVSMMDKGDAIQVRHPNGEYCHGISYGENIKINGGQDNLKITTHEGRNKVFSLAAQDYKLVTSFTTEEIEGQTPGKVNNKENYLFVKSLCPESPLLGTNNENITRGLLKGSIYPNTFHDQINLKLESTQYYESKIILTDMLGNEVFLDVFLIEEGDNLIQVKVNPNMFSNGVYYLKVICNGEVMLSEKIVHLK